MAFDRAQLILFQSDLLLEPKDRFLMLEDGDIEFQLRLFTFLILQHAFRPSDLWLQFLQTILELTDVLGDCIEISLYLIQS